MPPAVHLQLTQKFLVRQSVLQEGPEVISNMLVLAVIVLDIYQAVNCPPPHSTSLETRILFKFHADFVANVFQLSHCSNSSRMITGCV